MYYQTLTADLEALKNSIVTTMTAEQVQVVIGGDHGVAFAAVLALLQSRNPRDIGVIMFDSHADIHTATTSPSGNFHGMWLRPLVGPFDQPDLETLAHPKLPANQVLYIGNLVLEAQERLYLQEQGIHTLSREAVRTHWVETNTALRRFVARFNHIHVSFDMGVFDQNIVLATGTPSQDGFFEEDVFPLIEHLDGDHTFPIDLIEVNPQKQGAERTIRLAQEVLRRLLAQANVNLISSEAMVTHSLPILKQLDKRCAIPNLDYNGRGSV